VSTKPGQSQIGLSRIAAGHPINRIAELMPWAYQAPTPNTVA
jgi:hypothetical protein